MVSWFQSLHVFLPTELEEKSGVSPEVSEHPDKDE